MQRKEDEQQLQLLLHRVQELCDRAVGGQFVYTDFLTPRQAKHAQALLQRQGQLGRARLHGGYDSAERACLLLFPDYVVEALDREASISLWLEYAGAEDPVRALRIEGSGYRALSHRDYLGSLLSLGVERDVLGDIAVDESGATVLCLGRMVPFLLSHVERIGGDAVRIRSVELPSDFDGGRTYAPVQDTVASARLDCVVAALIGCSRERAQEAVRQALVELDYECEMRVDRILQPPCVISVRGEGKFILRDLSTQTRKGRWRLIADRYV